MSDPYLGEIRMFAGTFAPRGWALCDGQLIGVSQNEALFSLLGTIYGGDGRSTFGLPDLRGRIPMHMGSGPGLSSRTQGASFGEEQVTLTTAQLPAHSHRIGAHNKGGNTNDPSGAKFASDGAGKIGMYKSYNAGSDTAVSMGGTILNTGGGQPHNNLPPFLCINFIIATVGLFPSRS